MSKMFGSHWTSEESPRILDDTRYNGRLNIIDNPNTMSRFLIAEKIAIKNKATEYRDAVEGILECNVLAQVFFSEGNVQILQNGLRAGVYNLSGDKKLIIPPQNIDQLKIIMRSMYLQFGQFNLQESVTKQTETLNQFVLDYAVPAVYNESIGYLKYCQDQSSLVMPMARPQSIDRDHKHLEIKKWF